MIYSALPSNNYFLEIFSSGITPYISNEQLNEILNSTIYRSCKILYGTIVIQMILVILCYCITEHLKLHKVQVYHSPSVRSDLLNLIIADVDLDLE